MTITENFSVSLNLVGDEARVLRVLADKVLTASSAIGFKVDAIKLSEDELQLLSEIQDCIILPSDNVQVEAGHSIEDSNNEE